MQIIGKSRAHVILSEEVGELLEHSCTFFVSNPIIISKSLVGIGNSPSDGVGGIIALILSIPIGFIIPKINIGFKLKLVLKLL